MTDATRRVQLVSVPSTSADPKRTKEQVIEEKAIPPTKRFTLKLKANEDETCIEVSFTEMVKEKESKVSLHLINCDNALFLFVFNCLTISRRKTLWMTHSTKKKMES